MRKPGIELVEKLVAAAVAEGAVLNVSFISSALRELSVGPIDFSKAKAPYTGEALAFWLLFVGLPLWKE